MTKKEKAKIVSAILENLFPAPQIPLQHDSPFTLLIAVLLSAQCTDERVNKITPKLFALGSTPSEIMNLDPSLVEEIIRPCGLGKAKSKAIVKLSRDIQIEHEGIVPKSFEALEKLPGVGHKTASVVMAQAFDIPAFPVDTHIHRCAQRWGLSNGKNVVQTEKDLKRLFPKSKWNKLHLQIILYARKYCPARGHNEKKCPICYSLREHCKNQRI